MLGKTLTRGGFFRFWFSLCLGVSVVSAPARGQTVSTGEALCTTDSIAIAPLADNLSEGWHNVTLNWNVDGTAQWYRVYRSTANGGPYSLLADCIMATSYADRVLASQTFYYVVTAVNVAAAGGDQESGYSNQVTAAIPTFDALVVNEAIGASVQLNESLATSDALAPRAAFQSGLAETLSTSDALAWERASSAALAETLSTSDALTPSAAFIANPPVGLGETLSTNDALSINYRATVSVSESLTTSDSLNLSFAGGVSLAETLATSDALSELATARAANLSETLSTSDSLTLGAHFDPALTENLTTLDALVLTESFPAPPVAAPRPVLQGILPNQAAVSSCVLALTVNGLDFTPLSVVNWNLDSLTTTYVSPRQLTAVVPSSELQTAAPASVGVETPGGGTSTVLPFLVVVADPTVLLSQVRGNVLIVTGRNFVPTDVLLWDGTPLVTQYLSSGELEAGLPNVPFGLQSTQGHTVTAEDTRCGGP